MARPFRGMSDTQILTTVHRDNPQVHRGSMDIHGNPWMSMDVHGNPWISVDSVDSMGSLDLIDPMEAMESMEAMDSMDHMDSTDSIDPMDSTHVIFAFQPSISTGLASPKRSS